MGLQAARPLPSPRRRGEGGARTASGQGVYNPGGLWDDGVYNFAGRDELYTPSFLEYLHRRGELHEHAIYPIPDTVFRWNSGDSGGSGPSAVARVCRDEKEEKRAPAVDHATVEDPCVGDFGPLGRELSMTEAQVSGIKATGYRHPEGLHSDLPSCDTPISEAYWVYPDPSSSQSRRGRLQ